VQQFLDSGDAAGWINVVTQVEQAADSRLTLYRIQRHGQSQAHTSLLAVDLAAGAHASIGYVDLASSRAQRRRCAARRPRCVGRAVRRVPRGGGQHVDNHTRIDHAAPATRSDESFRGIIGRAGAASSTAKSWFTRARSRPTRASRATTFCSPSKPEIDAKPELEIYADDVKCSHGSTVGELDAEHLFYCARAASTTPARASS